MNLAAGLKVQFAALGLLAVAAVTFLPGQQQPVDAVLPVMPLRLDLYGGVPTRIAQPSSVFQKKKIGDRWILVTPEGNPFWMLGVFNVEIASSVDDLKDSYARRIVRKYKDKYAWGKRTVRRLKDWGFNSLAEYASWYVLPTKSPYSDWSNPVKMPFVAMIRPSYYALTNKQKYASGPVKDLIAADDPAIYTGWRGNGTPDVFDPNFAVFAAGMVKNLKKEVLESPWLIGISTDDADNIVGFGPGPEIPAARVHPHIGWIVLAANFEQRVNPKLHVTYSDPKVYSKYSLREFLAKKYGAISTLNTAWGSRYSTFDSDGGWGRGKGLLDENGGSPWVGKDFNRLSTATSAVRADLDDFLYQYAKQYFAVISAAIRHQAGEHLVFGPATLNGWEGLTRKEILRAAGEYVDVLQASVRSQRVLDLTEKYAGDVPLVTWTGMVANPDSALWRYPSPTEVTPGASTQEERARVYTRRITADFDATTASGTHTVVGTKFWAYTDSWREKRNWGLVSFLDNAYDGRQAIRAPGKDPAGFPTGGEEKDYGDFISGARAANFAIMQRLHEDSAALREATVRRAGK